MKFRSPFELIKPKKPAENETPSIVDAIGQGMVDVKDIIAPPALEVDFDFVKIGNMFYRTLFVSGYPRFVGANWLASVINFDHTLDLSFFYYPVESKGVLDDLKRKIAEMEATIQSDVEKGRVVNPAIEVALEDAHALQEQLVKGTERFFQFAFYITIPAESLEELNAVTKEVEATLGALMIISKHATLQMEQAFQSTIPTCSDKLYITRNMDTTSLATTFPFTSSELTANEGILYGINEHNGSLVIFDRFAMENANAVVFAKSGSGKSYLVKLEALRSLMFGAEIIVIDPESEYRVLAEAIGGEYISFSFDSPAKINPFDLSGVYEEGENELGLKILSLHALFRVMFGELSAMEDALLDRALIMTYKLKGITPDPATQKNEPPLMEDLYKVLMGMEELEARGMADRVEKFIKGSMSGIFDQRTTVNLRNTFTVFSIRDLEDQLRPIAMFIILDYIWTRVKREQKRRLLIVDEAWYLMKYPDSATFLYSIAKRARKYYLGLTTITQDVEDFLAGDYGKAIVTNSSIQILLKQSPAAIDKVAQVFYLSQGEKHLLLAAEVGEGLFFAGANHVAIRVQAAPHEHRLITTNPAELEKIAKEAQAAKLAQQHPLPAQTPMKVAESFPAQPTSEVSKPSQFQPTPVVESNVSSWPQPKPAGEAVVPVPTIVEPLPEKATPQTVTTGPVQVPQNQPFQPPFSSPRPASASEPVAPNSNQSKPIPFQGTIRPASEVQSLSDEPESTTTSISLGKKW
ncbi:MAG: ATP-binding protein [Patescibacteria group bacterium]|nr:ATP-binding protein [Patescibacteria group bacterium]